MPRWVSLLALNQRRTAPRHWSHTPTTADTLAHPNPHSSDLLNSIQLDRRAVIPPRFDRASGFSV